MTVSDFLSRLEKVHGRSPNWTARCPGHEDRSPSLSITDAGDKILLKCHAGCAPEQVVAALGIEMGELFVDARPRVDREIAARYEYTDADGRVVFEVVRFIPKDFRQRRPDGQGGWTWNLSGIERVLYRLPQVIAAVARGKRVFVVEGEKDVQSVEAAGYTATCNAGGAGKWQPGYAEVLTGARVVVVADQDEPGYAHARAVAASLQGVARSVVVVAPAVGKDVTDHLCAGKTLAELVPTQGEQSPPDDTARIRNTRIRGEALATLDDQHIVGSWGWRDFDRSFGPLVAGWLYVIGARPGNGKSSLLLTLLSRLREDRIPTLYFGTEMAPADLVKKWAALRLGLDELRVFGGGLTATEREAVEREIHYVTAADEVTFSTTSRLNQERLTAEVVWAFDARRGPLPRVIVLDHLHQVTQDREELEQLIKELKELAKERRVAMLVASQLNREKDVGLFDLYLPPSLSRYKGTAAIEESVDVGLGLFRPLRRGVKRADRAAVERGEVQVADLAEPNMMGVVCLKHRYNGRAQGRFVGLTVNGSRLESRSFLPAPIECGDAYEESEPVTEADPTLPF